MARVNYAKCSVIHCNRTQYFERDHYMDSKIFVNSSTTFMANLNQPVIGQRLVAGHCQFVPLWFIDYVHMLFSGFISSILLRNSIPYVRICFKSCEAYSVIVSNSSMRQNALCLWLNGNGNKPFVWRETNNNKTPVKAHLNLHIKI